MTKIELVFIWSLWYYLIIERVRVISRKEFAGLLVPIVVPVIIGIGSMVDVVLASSDSASSTASAVARQQERDRRQERDSHILEGSVVFTAVMGLTMTKVIAGIERRRKNRNLA